MKEAHVIYVHIPLPRTQAHVHRQHGEKLGSAVWLWARFKLGVELDNLWNSCYAHWRVEELLAAGEERERGWKVSMAMKTKSTLDYPSALLPRSKHIPLKHSCSPLSPSPSENGFPKWYEILLSDLIWAPLCWLQKVHFLWASISAALA